jgi:hypothetical protein
MSFHLRVVMPSHPRFLAIVRAAVSGDLRGKVMTKL